MARCCSTFTFDHRRRRSRISVPKAASNDVVVSGTTVKVAENGETELHDVDPGWVLFTLAKRSKLEPPSQAPALWTTSMA